LLKDQERDMEEVASTSETPSPSNSKISVQPKKSSERPQLLINFKPNLKLLRLEQKYMDKKQLLDTRNNSKDSRLNRRREPSQLLKLKLLILLLSTMYQSITSPLELSERLKLISSSLQRNKVAEELEPRE
jgi:hypothetical protein